MVGAQGIISEWLRLYYNSSCYGFLSCLLTPGKGSLNLEVCEAMGLV